jgi:hypothetical protein
LLRKTNRCEKVSLALRQSCRHPTP